MLRRLRQKGEAEIRPGLVAQCRGKKALLVCVTDNYCTLIYPSVLFQGNVYIYNCHAQNLFHIFKYVLQCIL